MSAAAATFDRRIRLEQKTEVQDAAGDVIPASWGAPAGWPANGGRWAGLRQEKPMEAGGDSASQVVTRQVDTVFLLRVDQYSTVIAPETFRVVYKSRVYEIVGLGAGRERHDVLELRCCSRPDQRGASGPEPESGQS